jgi:hypothetical protein
VPIRERLRVLLHAVLYDFGAMPITPRCPYTRSTRAVEVWPNSRETVQTATGAPWSVVWSRAAA